MNKPDNLGTGRVSFASRLSAPLRRPGSRGLKARTYAAVEGHVGTKPTNKPASQRFLVELLLVCNMAAHCAMYADMAQIVLR